MRDAARIGVLSAMALFLFARPSVAQGSMDQAARALFESADHERTSRGIPALKWDASLAQAASQHAVKMAQQHTLSHQFPGEPDVPTRESRAGAKISAAAENVAYGSSADAIHNGWMHSPPHRRNLLDPQMNSIGIAVVQQGSLLFAVEDFSRALAPLSLTEQENRVASIILRAGLRIRPGDNDARNVCEGGQATTRPGLIGQFSTTDLSELPTALERAVRSGKYMAAQVGACTKSATDNLSQYHIAVLLY